MPRIQKVFTLDITPEQFLNNCSGTELREIKLLLASPRFKFKLELSESIAAKETVPQCRMCGCTLIENEKFISKTLCEDCWESPIENRS